MGRWFTPCSNAPHSGTQALSDQKPVRGYTVVAALCDELGFWAGEASAEPDVEIINAVRPAMATIPNAMLLCASSPVRPRWPTGA